MNTLYKTVALALTAPVLVGAVMFAAGLLALVTLIGYLYDASTTAKPPAPDAQ